MALTQVDQGLLGTYAQYTGFKNRIINGAMVIDQRNAGASVTPTSGSYTLDRWKIYCSQASKFSVQQNAGSVTPPAGYINYLGATSLSAYTVGAGEEFDICQFIEGLNCTDLSFGTANAKTVTLSFWVRSSLTGTFGGALQNSGSSRSYVFSYTISSANTWEQKSITIAGDTSGTWLTTNGTGINCTFGIGQGSSLTNTAGSWYTGNYNNVTGAVSIVGTNGATFYITGVQLEKGSTATSFDYRPYGTELALCQRYCTAYNADGQATNSKFAMAMAISTTNARVITPFPVKMRISPSLTVGATASVYGINNYSGDIGCNSVPVINTNSTTLVGASEWQVASGLTAGHAVIAQANGNNTAYLIWSAEL